jgi:indolepyruvate ferredoxin oxidoreductase
VKIGGYADSANKIMAGTADAYLVFDLLEAGKEKNLRHARAGRTTAVISMSMMATGEMVRSTAVSFPQQQFLQRSIEDRTRKDRNIVFDASALSENIFGSHMQANMIVVGAAYQAGLIPLRAETIENVIRVNGVSAKANILAFRIGRKVVAEPNWQPLSQLKREGDLDIAPQRTPDAQALIDSVNADGELRRLLDIRVPELIAYQNVAYAREYADFIAQVYAAEARVTNETRLSEAVARSLFKLMAYKDEYEVARLHTRPEFHRALDEQFGDGAKVVYQLHPPFLRALGVNRKIGFGRWFDAGYWLLRRMKFVRGTALDPFGYAHVRRVERALIGEYRALMDDELLALSADTYDRAVRLATLPDMIRGYEDIKLRNVEAYHETIEQIRSAAPEVIV